MPNGGPSPHPGPYPMLRTSNFGYNPFTRHRYVSHSDKVHSIKLYRLGSDTISEPPYPLLFTSNAGYNPFTREAFVSHSDKVHSLKLFALGGGHGGPT